jgi:hypothetical protein
MFNKLITYALSMDANALGPVIFTPSPFSYEQDQRARETLVLGRIMQHRITALTLVFERAGCGSLVRWLQTAWKAAVRGSAKPSAHSAKRQAVAQTCPPKCPAAAGTATFAHRLTPSAVRDLHGSRM